MSTELSRLRVGDEDFLVASMIERCPKAMMLRELVKNALEAAERPDHSGAPLRQVEIGGLRVGGVRKLAIWNTGLGMNAAEMVRMCDIASSIGKANGLDQNFGMGAKVASLPSNQHGIRYRSCRDGLVHQVLMGKRDGWYGRLRQARADGSLADVIDITDLAVREGYGMANDWTEVVLLGNDPAQDTLADPYGGSPAVPAGWIGLELHRRFFDLPDGLSLILKPAVHGQAGDQAFQPVRRRFPTAFARHEAVVIEQGVIVHFAFEAADDRPGGSDGVPPVEAGVAVVYKDEIYDVRRGGDWLRDAPLFGVPFGARHFSVYVALPDGHPVLPDAYRQFLRWRENGQHHVTAGHFARQIVAARPGWLLALIRQLAPDAQNVEAARGDMAALFARLQVRRRWWPPPIQQPEPLEPAPVAPAATPPAEDQVEYEVPPQIIALRDPEDVRARGLEGTAARFYADTHLLFINTSYPAVDAVRDVLEREFPGEATLAAARAVAELTITRQVCRKLAHALAKRDQWAHWQVDQAASPYSLTLAADDHRDALGWARAELRRRATMRASPALATGATSDRVSVGFTQQ